MADQTVTVSNVPLSVSVQELSGDQLRSLFQQFMEPLKAAEEKASKQQDENFSDLIGEVKNLLKKFDAPAKTKGGPKENQLNEIRKNTRQTKDHLIDIKKIIRDQANKFSSLEEKFQDVFKSNKDIEEILENSFEKVAKDISDAIVSSVGRVSINVPAFSVSLDPLDTTLNSINSSLGQLNATISGMSGGATSPPTPPSSPSSSGGPTIVELIDTQWDELIIMSVGIIDELTDIKGLLTSSGGIGGKNQFTELTKILQDKFSSLGITVSMGKSKRIEDMLPPGLIGNIERIEELKATGMVRISGNELDLLEKKIEKILKNIHKNPMFADEITSAIGQLERLGKIDSADKFQKELEAINNSTKSEADKIKEINELLKKTNRLIVEARDNSKTTWEKIKSIADTSSSLVGAPSLGLMAGNAASAEKEIKHYSAATHGLLDANSSISKEIIQQNDYIMKNGTGLTDQLEILKERNNLLEYGVKDLQAQTQLITDSSIISKGMNIQQEEGLNFVGDMALSLRMSSKQSLSLLKSTAQISKEFGFSGKKVLSMASGLKENLRVFRDLYGVSSGMVKSMTSLAAAGEKFQAPNKILGIMKNLSSTYNFLNMESEDFNLTISVAKTLSEKYGRSLQKDLESGFATTIQGQRLIKEATADTLINLKKTAEASGNANMYLQSLYGKDFGMEALNAELKTVQSSLAGVKDSYIKLAELKDLKLKGLEGSLDFFRKKKELLDMGLEIKNPEDIENMLKEQGETVRLSILNSIESLNSTFAKTGNFTKAFEESDFARAFMDIAKSGIPLEDLGLDQKETADLLKKIEDGNLTPKDLKGLENIEKKLLAKSDEYLKQVKDQAQNNLQENILEAIQGFRYSMESSMTEILLNFNQSSLFGAITTGFTKLAIFGATLGGLYKAVNFLVKIFHAGGLMGAISSIITFAKSVTGFAGIFQAGISTMLGSIGLIISSFLAGLALPSITKWLEELDIPVLTWITGFINRTFTLIGDGIGGILNILWNSIVDRAQIFWDVITGDWSSAWEGVKKMGANTWRDVCSLFKTSWENLFDAIVSILPKWMRGNITTYKEDRDEKAKKALKENFKNKLDSPSDKTKVDENILLEESKKQTDYLKGINDKSKLSEKIEEIKGRKLEGQSGESIIKPSKEFENQLKDLCDKNTEQTFSLYKPLSEGEKGKLAIDLLGRSLPSFQEGGITPGNQNEQSLALVHGQEQIIPKSIWGNIKNKASGFLENLDFDKAIDYFKNDFSDNLYDFVTSPKIDSFLTKVNDTFNLDKLTVDFDKFYNNLDNKFNTMPISDTLSSVATSPSISKLVDSFGEEGFNFGKLKSGINDVLNSPEFNKLQKETSELLSSKSLGEHTKELAKVDGFSQFYDTFKKNITPSKVKDALSRDIPEIVKSSEFSQLSDKIGSAIGIQDLGSKVDDLITSPAYSSLLDKGIEKAQGAIDRYIEPNIPKVNIPGIGGSEMPVGAGIKEIPTWEDNRNNNEQLAPLHGIDSNTSQAVNLLKQIVKLLEPDPMVRTGGQLSGSTPSTKPNTRNSLAMSQEHHSTHFSSWEISSPNSIAAASMGSDSGIA